MRDRLFSNGNNVYLGQVAVMMFFMVVTYKIVMLPKYLSMYAPRDFVIGALIAMLIEMLLFGMVFFSIKYAKVTDMYAHKWISRLLLLGVAISSIVKLMVLSVETLDYISTLLFQEGRWLFIILTLVPAIAYIAYKGANTIARLSEILIWAVVFAFLFTILFMRAEIEVDNILPLFDDGIGAVVTAYMRHSLWFGDFLPFLVLEVSHARNRLDKVAIPIGMAITYIVTVGFFLLFVSIYGDVAPFIKYAFSNIGIYNSISTLLGGVDFPIVCVWLLMAIVKLSFLLYAVVYSIEWMIGKRDSHRTRGIVVAILAVALMLALSFGVEGVSDMYDFATGPIRYIVLVMDVSIPLVVFITTLVKRKQYRYANTHTSI